VQIDHYLGNNLATNDGVTRNLLTSGAYISKMQSSTILWKIKYSRKIRSEAVPRL
jgi:hypothetical protein